MVNFILFPPCCGGGEGRRALGSGKRGKGKGNLYSLFIHTSTSFHKKDSRWLRGTEHKLCQTLSCVLCAQHRRKDHMA